MLALEFLSEGYAPSHVILPQVFAAWDSYGVAQAFPDFAILSHLPIVPTSIAECCDRAQQMAAHRKITDPVARCAGKLLEQVICVAAGELRPHFEAIAQVATTSKIFFRVDTRSLKHRLDLYELEADTLAVRLDSAIETLSRQPNDTSAFRDGLQAMEALRFRHPNYIDMNTAIANTPSDDDSPRSISFKLSLGSLMQFEQIGVEASLARHLVDQRESIYVNTVEALVRIGSPLAAAHLLSQFNSAQPNAQRWIARGLQRIRATGLAAEIAHLRARVLDPALWLMLLVAEIRQFEEQSLLRITADVQQVQTYAGALLDALSVYVRIHATAPGSRGLQQAFMDYVQGANQEIQSKIESRLQ